VLNYLNTSKVPDLFVASGSRSWNQPQADPYTFGYNPDYTIEGKIIANYIQQNLAGTKVCVFGQNDDFGADGLAGVKDILTDAGVTHSETYDVTNTNVAPQIGAFKAAGCQVIVSFTVPGFTALAVGTAAQLGLRAQWIVSNVGADYVTLQGFLKDAAPLLLQGLLSTAYLPSTADTANPWVQLFQKLNTQYNNNATWDGNVEYGFAVGYTFVEALKAAGKNLTRAALVAAVEKNGLTGPGLSAFRFSATDHSGYGGLQMAKIDNGTPTLFGPVYTTDDGSGAVTTVSASSTTPPTNGIP
jgi:ABC-type branched-subunit amino acid transport system substrate-binding protein